ncbi:phage tail tape measure protein [Salmonella bongori]|uniref:phage tail tape measure protein n=1 Tax=Salmonella bongori TaxID=54736 RepID=UPI0008FFD7BC
MPTQPEKCDRLKWCWLIFIKLSISTATSIQLSFFKDIAGEEAAKSFPGRWFSLRAVVNCKKLLGELKKAQGESATVARKMADNLDGDLKNLDSAWEGFRIQIEELVDGPLRGLVQGISNVVGAMTDVGAGKPRTDGRRC